MPTPRLAPGHPKWDLALEAWKLRQDDLFYKDVAAKLGEKQGTVEHWVKVVDAYQSAPEGQNEAIEAAGLNHATATHGWRVIQHEDGSRDSVFWKRQEVEEEDLEDRIAEKFHDIPAAPAVRLAGPTDTQLLSLYPLFDVHIGLRNGSYGLQDSVSRLVDGMAGLVGRTEPSETAIILNGGDWTHHNDNANRTPQSGHPLDVDCTYEDALEASIEVTAHLIEMALHRHRRVIYAPLVGNHDPHTARVLRYALGQRYRNEDRVTVADQGLVFFAYEWGKNLICAHHGDTRGNGPKELVMRFAAHHADAWGRTAHRTLFTGHLHHLKAQEFPGMDWRQMRAVAPASRYDQREGYASKAQMLSVTYHETEGPISEATHIFRAAA